jgi:uncharacterized integral membrane protein (TIGR00697 family)
MPFGMLPGLPVQSFRPSSLFMKPKYLDLIGAVFVTTLLVSNIIASKIGAFGGFFMPVGVVIFPLSYILGDILTEVYGYAATRRIIWIGFLCNLIAVVAYFAARSIPAAPFYQDSAAFDLIFSAAPRILFASFVAYLVGSFANAFVLAKLKVTTNGKFLWMRTIGSTIVGEGLDSAIFILIAFSGIFEMPQVLSLIMVQWIFKCAFEIVVTPLTYGIVGFLKKTEGRDHYDRTTNFQPFTFAHADK